MNARRRLSLRIPAGLLAAAALGTPAAAPRRARAAEPDPAVPEVVAKAIPGARLLGQGTYRWFGFRVYDARLFANPQDIDAAAPTRSPLALELAYARSFDGAAIAGRSDEEMATIGRGDPAERARWRVLMSSVFPDVREGDRLLGLWRPGGPTRFYYNGRALGSIAGADFGPAFFGIWLDPRTSAPELRAQLLARVDR